MYTQIYTDIHTVVSQTTQMDVHKRKMQANANTQKQQQAHATSCTYLVQSQLALLLDTVGELVSRPLHLQFSIACKNWRCRSLGMRVEQAMLELAVGCLQSNQHNIKYCDGSDIDLFEK